MTQDIIDMAKHAGIICFGDIHLKRQELEAFAKLVENAAFKRWAAQTKLAVQDEREACAEVLLNLDLCGREGVAADAIRARGEA